MKLKGKSYRAEKTKALKNHTPLKLRSATPERLRDPMNNRITSVLAAFTLPKWPTLFTATGIMIRNPGNVPVRGAPTACREDAVQGASKQPDECVQLKLAAALGVCRE